MKRILAILLAAVMLLGSVTACSENKPDRQETPTQTADTPTAQDPVPEETEHDILAYLGEADWQGRTFTGLCAMCGCEEEMNVTHPFRNG